MIIRIKNKYTLNVWELKLKCCIGKKGISKNKVEGDLRTPSGKFNLGNLYWRSDRIKKPETKLFCKKIKKNMGWCNDSNSPYYNKEIQINKKIKHEKLYRHDYKYNYFIVIHYNYPNYCYLYYFFPIYQNSNQFIIFKNLFYYYHHHLK